MALHFFLPSLCPDLPSRLLTTAGRDTIDIYHIPLLKPTSPGTSPLLRKFGLLFLPFLCLLPPDFSDAFPLFSRRERTVPSPMPVVLLLYIHDKLLAPKYIFLLCKRLPAIFFVSVMDVSALTFCNSRFKIFSFFFSAFHVSRALAVPTHTGLLSVCP